MKCKGKLKRENGNEVKEIVPTEWSGNTITRVAVSLRFGHK